MHGSLSHRASRSQRWSCGRTCRKKRSGGMGRRTSMCRYGASLHTCMERLPWWHKEVWERTTFAMETDALRGKSLRAKLMSACEREDDTREVTGGPTHPKHLTTEDKSLKKACVNGVASGVLTLEQRDHLLVCSAVVVSSRPMDRYHTQHIRDCRSVDENQAWLIRMATGGHMAHLCEFVALLYDR